jgi:hypothetical protein
MSLIGDILGQSPDILGEMQGARVQRLIGETWTDIEGSMGNVRDVGEQFDNERNTTYDAELLTAILPQSAPDLTRGMKVKYAGNEYTVLRIRSLVASRQLEAERRLPKQRGPDRGQVNP